MEDLATPSGEAADCAQLSTLKSGFQERLSLLFFSANVFPFRGTIEITTPFVAMKRLLVFDCG